MTLITGIIADSAGVPANGTIEFTQVSRIDTGSKLVTGVTATAQVVEGALLNLDGSGFDMPANPDGTAVRVLERLTGPTFEWWAQIPATGPVEYRSLVPVTPIDTPEFAPPSWLADVYQARDETLAVIESVGGLAGIDQAVTDAQTAQAGAASYATSAQSAKTASESAQTASETARDTAVAAAGTATAGRTLPIPASVVTGYSRTTPTPGGVQLRMLMRDPTVSGRVWGKKLPSGKFGYSDDHGATFVDKFDAPEEAAAGAPSMRSWNGFVYLIQVPTAAALVRRGQIWRSPIPDSSGNGWSWTKIFDLNAPPAGFTAGLNSTFRSDSLWGVGSHVYFGEYSPAKVGTTTGDAVTTSVATEGPGLFCAPDNGNTWYMLKRFNARHIHAGAIIGGNCWLTLGDAGSSWLHRGLWSCTGIGVDKIFTIRSLSTEANAGYDANNRYGINLLGLDVAGGPMVVMESDGRDNAGPLVYQGQSTTGNRPLVPLNRPPFPYNGSMRHITLTPEGNLMWLQTGEQGAISDFDTVMVSRGPFFSEAVAVEALPAASNLFASAGDSVLDGEGVWFGSHYIHRPLFPGQSYVAPAPVPNPPIVTPSPIVPDHVWVAPATGSDGDQVASWAPTTGTVALTQATSGAQPKLATQGSTRVIRFDGVDDYLEATGIGTSQPTTILWRIFVTGYGSFGGGLAAPNGTGWVFRWDSNGKPFLGTLAGANGDVPLNTWITIAACAAGAQSEMRIGSKVYTGDMGTTNAMNSIRLGYVFQSGAGQFAPFDIAKQVIYRTARLGADLTAAIAAM